MFDNVTVLAVDDDSMNLEMLEFMLTAPNYTIHKASNGQQALDMLKIHQNVDVVLLDLEMPVMNGYETIKHIKQSFSWRDIPIIVVTAGASEVTRALALGVNDFIAKPYNSEELRLRVRNQVHSKKLSDMAKDMNSVLEAEVVKKTSALREALALSKDAEFEISVRLGRAAEYRDQETGNHTIRISVLSKLLGNLLGLPADECELLRFASTLHDVGKVGVPDSILLKPGKLDEAEFAIMKQHTIIGGKILSDADRFPVIQAAGIIAEQHHEKWNGSGYPKGLRGEDIHIFARIVSIVDVFDALSSDRPYKKAFPLDKTISIMEEGKGDFFDPALLELFMQNISEFVAIRDSLKDHQDEELHACDVDRTT